MQTLPLNICLRCFELKSKKAHRIFLACKQTCESKFESLIKKRNNISKNVKNGPDCALTDSWFTNLNDIHIFVN